MDLHKHYGEDVFVAVSDVHDERIAMAYDITTDLKDGPRSFYIDTDGMVYYYNSKNWTVGEVTDWIDRKRF